MSETKPRPSTRPAKVRILGKRFTYRYVDTWPGKKRDDVGESDPVTQIMWIKEGQSFESEQDTVIHEYVESAAALMGFGENHNLIIQITTMVHQMFENGALIAYLRRRK